MASELVKTIESFLKENKGTTFTSMTIADKLVASYPDYIKTRKDKTQKTEQELKQQIRREINSYIARSAFSDNIKISIDTPKQLFFSDHQDTTNITCPTEETKRTIKKEEEKLYPLLCEYLHNSLRIYPMRIDEKTSSNKNGKNFNEWLHPDVVGLQVISEDWTDEIKEFANHSFIRQTNLWSFEVKTELTPSNVRSSFFQTVSNSSWANYSYLVAPYIEDKAKKELEILCKCHNIGIILLNKDYPSDSQIIIPAHETTNLDLNIMNRLKENKDFDRFIKNIRAFYKLKEIDQSKWDIPE